MSIQEKKKIFKIRKVIRDLIQTFLPKTIRHSVFRRGTRFNQTLPSGLIFRVARSKSELECAFRLLHDCYVRADLMEPHTSGLRVTKYHALPSTTTLVAVWDGKIVGTVSLIRRGAFGLPMENIFDLEFITKTGARVLEVSALAIDPEFSGQRGQILFPFCKFLIEYSHKYFGANYLSIAVHPQWLEFYEAVLLFEPIEQQVIQNYSFVKGAPAAGGILNLGKWSENLKRVYQNAPPENNGYRYFKELKFDNFKYPERNIPKISDPIWTPELIDYFFNERTQVLSQMEERELAVLYQLYRENDFQKVFPPVSKSNLLHFRNEPRFEVSRPGMIRAANGRNILISIVNASENGFTIFSTRGLRKGQKYTVEVDLDEETPAVLIATVRWQVAESSQCGLQVVESTQNWKVYIRHLSNDLYQKTGITTQILPTTVSNFSLT